MTLPKFYWWIIGGIFIVLLLFFLFLGSSSRPQALNDQTVRQALQSSGRLPLKICLPSHVELEQRLTEKMSEQSIREVNGLLALGLVKTEPQASGETFVLKATPQAQPFVTAGKICLAQARYGQFKSTADARVVDGSQTVVVKIMPELEALPGVRPVWLTDLHVFENVQGMDAVLVETARGWQVNEVSLY